MERPNEQENASDLITKNAATKRLIMLGVESSCDDTAAAVVVRHPDGRGEVLSNIVWGQQAEHAAFGGVVPEIAARSHVERVDIVITRAMEDAGVSYGALDGIAATAGPGLVGGVMVGLTTAKAVALTHNLPLIPVNHLAGHALTARMVEETPFPYLLLLISGGHSQLLAVDGVDAFERLGSTIDDAAGEAFDKTAKLLGLGQPGGPHVEAAARRGDPKRHELPRPLLKRPGCDFSFSGLKTAVRLAAEDAAKTGAETPAARDQTIADIAASFQAAVARHLAERTIRAMALFEKTRGARRLVVAGGVAANAAIGSALREAAEARGWRMTAPPAKYCTDNGAMIAWAGLERAAVGLTPAFDEAIATAPKARWPLAPPVANNAIGGGKKGPKA